LRINPKESSRTEEGRKEGYFSHVQNAVWDNTASIKGKREEERDGKKISLH